MLVWQTRRWHRDKKDKKLHRVVLCSPRGGNHSWTASENVSKNISCSQCYNPTTQVRLHTCPLLQAEPQIFIWTLQALYLLLLMSLLLSSILSCLFSFHLSFPSPLFSCFLSSCHFPVSLLFPFLISSFFNVLFPSFSQSFSAFLLPTFFLPLPSSTFFLNSFSSWFPSFVILGEKILGLFYEL